jgi:quinol monooxygenase YgiN
MPFYTTVRGRLRDADPQAAMEAHNTVVGRLRPHNEPLGGVGHRVFANVQDPQEFLAMDTWESMEGLQQAMGDPDVQSAIGSLFDGQPEVTIWSPREGWTTF